MSSETADADTGLTSEHVLLVAMLVIASYMFVESFSFGRSAAYFPRLMSAVTIVGTSLLLVRNYLPSPLYAYVAESSDMMSSYSPGEEEGEESDFDPARGRPIPASAFTVFALVAYVLGAYYVGLFWVTPVFVFVFTSWFRLGWISRIALSAAGLGVIYAFMVVMNVNFKQGFLV
jgi:hypothetical protein